MAGTATRCEDRLYAKWPVFYDSPPLSRGQAGQGRGESSVRSGSHAKSALALGCCPRLRGDEFELWSRTEALYQQGDVIVLRLQLIAKEVFDRVGAAVLLVAVLPCMILAAAIIKLSSRGPVLFTQQRVGLHERPFVIYKFRTMHMRSADEHGTTVTTRDDPRVFFGGQFLRKHKIDELPQLWNVLIGDMSLVGPRPTVMDDHRRMDQRQRQRSRMKPGITGAAQVNGAASIPWPQRIEYELNYIENYSLWLDVKIVAKTAWLLLTGGADANPPTEDEWGDGSDAGAKVAPFELGTAAPGKLKDAA